MRYAIRLGLNIFILGLIILSVTMFTVYVGNKNTTINSELQHTIALSTEASINIEQLLLEKVKTTQTLSITPTLKAALEESNRSYSQLSEIRRNEKIQLQNEEWQASNDENNAFILEFTDNDTARFLKEQQNNLEGEYGEIFLTNKYGALVASTAKLTTFAHHDKYWWQGAFNNGEGAVFFDDRGYDDSVGGYVLGLVVPIKQGDEIIGILKVNLNILGAISQLILSSQNEYVGDFKLVRSGGEIIFEENSEPLKNRVPDVISEKLELGNNQSFVFDDSEKKWLIGMSEIGITSGIKGYDFGGTFKSIDHQKGNIGESWYIINYHSMENVLSSLKVSTLMLSYTGILLIFFLAFTAFFLGNQTVKPLIQLIEQSEEVAKGDLSSRITTSRKDEIGHLGNAFNAMAKGLEKTTTSIEKLEAEITKRARVQKELQKERDFAENLLNTAQIIILVLDVEGRIVRFNSYMESLSGYSLAEVQGQSWFSVFLPEQDNLKLRTLFKNAIGDGPTKNNTSPITTKDGHERQIEWSDSTLRDTKGSITGLLSVGLDITERKQAEEDKQEFEAHLRQHQKLEAIGTLASGVAHEINNPIMGIMNYAQLIHDRIDPGESRLREFSAGIIKETKRVAKIVHNLLTFSRQEKQSHSAARMTDIVNDTLLLIGTVIKRDQITLEVDMPENLPPIKCRSQQIQQVIMNLLTNARDALNERYPEYASEKIISMRANLFEKDGQHWLRTTIEDRGAGIPVEIRERIFNPFYTTKDQAAGTGLGLSISLGIVQDHHGKLTFESEENQFTRFYLDLPIDKG